MAGDSDAAWDGPGPEVAADAFAAGASHLAGVDSLVARCRALWRQGDWHSLAGYGIGDVELHPQRASLALMVAAAHQALGQAEQTRLFVDQARQWGCEPQLIARTLIAGVHNTLGRAMAAAGKQRHRARQHFTDAMAAGGGASAGELNLQDRVRHQLGSMRLEADVTGLLEGAADATPPVLLALSPAREHGDALLRSSTLTLIRLKEQGQQLASVRRAIEATVRKETANAVSQLEAHANLQRYLSEGQLMPELHGWPVSPDFAIMLVDMVESNDYDLVIEFGSGTSTLLMAIALARAAKRRHRSPPAVQVAFEHLEVFHQQTRSRLEQAGFADAVQLELARLQPWTSAQGTAYTFYACQEPLEVIVHATPGPTARALVVVDGPPAATGKHARYPALPIVLASLQGVAMDILLDDHDRPEEQEVSKMWLADLEAAGRRASVSAPALEKGACLIRVEA
jgi:hypothetical protein